MKFILYWPLLVWYIGAVGTVTPVTPVDVGLLSFPSTCVTSSEESSFRIFLKMREG